MYEMRLCRSGVAAEVCRNGGSADTQEVDGVQCVAHSAHCERRDSPLAAAGLRLQSRIQVLVLHARQIPVVIDT